MAIVYDEKKPIILDYLICPKCASTLPQPPADSFSTVDDYVLHVTTRQPVSCGGLVGIGDDAKPCGWQGHVIYGRRSLG